jgi:hypothetical protein
MGALCQYEGTFYREMGSTRLRFFIISLVGTIIYGVIMLRLLAIGREGGIAR